MINKKVCLIGAFGVGKTSLIERFVYNIFSEKYMSTIGVKVDKKEITLENGSGMNLLIWDLAGQEESAELPDSYLRGMSGYLLVADGTRRETLASALRINVKLRERYSRIPFEFLINKSDLMGNWEISPRDYRDYIGRGVPVRLTSARDGTAVEESFTALANRMVSAENDG